MRLPNWPRWVWRCYAATFAAVGVFVLCSLLPMWEVSTFVFGGWCGVGDADHHSLWGMLGSDAPGTYSDETSRRIVIWHWEGPAVFTAVSGHVATILGAILGGVRWRKGEKGPNERNTDEEDEGRDDTDQNNTGSV